MSLDCGRLNSTTDCGTDTDWPGLRPGCDCAVTGLCRQLADLKERVSNIEKKLVTAKPADVHKLQDVLKGLTERQRELKRPPTVRSPFTPPPRPIPPPHPGPGRQTR